MARLHRLYEQEKSSNHIHEILGEYVLRWQLWAKTGLREIKKLHNGGAELYKVCSALNTIFLLHQITGGVRSQNIPENLRSDLRGSTNH